MFALVDSFSIDSTEGEESELFSYALRFYEPMNNILGSPNTCDLNINPNCKILISNSGKFYFYVFYKVK